MKEAFDCVVIGGGPAGLTAAIYLARFHLRTLVIDAGRSRAATIPTTRNHAGYPDGIAGAELVARMRAQAERYGTIFLHGVAERIERRDGGFAVTAGEDQVDARAVLLATGVVNNAPAIDPHEHDRAVARGLLRYCPICDGYEVTDAQVGVIGSGERGMREAMFLRGYTADVTLIAADGAHALGADQRRELDAAGVAIVDGPARLAIAGERMRVDCADGALLFDSVYPALGSVIRSELAVAIGAEASEDGCLTVDAHQRTTVPGLFAAGDIVLGLDQISHAMGEGGVAATTIRNELAAEGGLLRPARTAA